MFVTRVPFPTFSAYVANPDGRVVYVDSRDVGDWFTAWGEQHDYRSMRETLWEWAAEGWNVAMIVDQEIN